MVGVQIREIEQKVRKVVIRLLEAHWRKEWCVLNEKRLLKYMKMGGRQQHCHAYEKTTRMKWMMRVATQIAVKIKRCR